MTNCSHGALPSLSLHCGNNPMILYPGRCTCRMRELRMWTCPMSTGKFIHTYSGPSDFRGLPKSYKMRQNSLAPLCVHSNNIHLRLINKKSSKGNFERKTTNPNTQGVCNSKECSLPSWSIAQTKNRLVWPRSYLPSKKKRACANPNPGMPLATVRTMMKSWTRPRTDDQHFLASVYRLFNASAQGKQILCFLKSYLSIYLSKIFPRQYKILPAMERRQGGLWAVCKRIQTNISPRYFNDNDVIIA